MSVPRLSVVIPSYGRPGLLARVVPAYLSQRPDEVVVVLDGPQPQARAVLDALTDARLRVLELPTNRGAAAARAAGARAAIGDLVLISDDDILPGPGMLDRHRAFHRRVRHGVLAGYLPVELGARGPGQVAARLYAADYERAARCWRRRPEQVLDGLWGGNVSLPRSLYLAASADPDGPAGYFEDMELGLRLRALGATGHFDPDAVGAHLYRKSSRDLVADAAARGAAARLMRHRWQGQVGLLHAADEPAWVRALRRAVAVASQVPGMVPAVVWPLRAALAGCGRLRRWRAEELTGRLLRGVVETHAYARAGRAAGSAGRPVEQPGRP
ncbi:glycosyltransferase family 2 protein [Pilimelia columellifera]|uniref:Glycosyltransferase 2-like domain-containing protein n=1 Tax=Pilimelia columellifera subsp. columellifera TaxID=706583 RepID=A0ABN3N1X9_9ACTN